MWWMLLVACHDGPEGDPGTVAPATADELAAPGPWQVGHRETEVDYTDPLGEPRSLRLALWWPTDDTAGIPAKYWRGSVDAGPGVYEEASIAAGPFPLVVFSHGHMGYAENSSFLMEHLASHGFVVAAPDHTGNTTLDGEDRTTAIYYQRPADLSAVIDYATGLADLGAVIDPEPAPGAAGSVIVLGHSFGGYTILGLGGASYDEAALACPDPTTDFCSTMTDAARDVFRAGLRDDRVLALLPMAPGDFGLYGEGLADVVPPTFLMGGTLDPGGDGQPFWDVLGQDPDDLRLVIDGAGHQTFTDFSGLLETFDGLIDPELGFRIIDVYALAWARAALGDATVSDILDGTASVDGSARLEQPAP